MKNVKVLRGVDASSDHRLLLSKLQLKLKKMKEEEQ